MTVQVKLVIFYHEHLGIYCSSCPALRCSFGQGSSAQECIRIVKDEYLLWELRNRNICSNLKKYGWQITNDAVIPPTFTDEEAVAYTERMYELQIPEHQIVVIQTVVPDAKR